MGKPINFRSCDEPLEEKYAGTIAALKKNPSLIEKPKIIAQCQARPIQYVQEIHNGQPVILLDQPIEVPALAAAEPEKRTYKKRISRWPTEEEFRLHRNEMQINWKKKHKRRWREIHNHSTRLKRGYYHKHPEKWPKRYPEPEWLQMLKWGLKNA